MVKIYLKILQVIRSLEFDDLDFEEVVKLEIVIDMDRREYLLEYGQMSFVLRIRRY